MNQKNKKNELLEDVLIDALAVLVAVRDGVPYRKRLDDIIEKLRKIIDLRMKYSSLKSS